MERYGLLSRSGYWYFRIRVPVGLQRLLKCREIKRSLGKCDLNLAEPAAKLARLKLKEIFTQIQEGVMDHKAALLIINEEVGTLSRIIQYKRNAQAKAERLQALANVLTRLKNEANEELSDKDELALIKLFNKKVNEHRNSLDLLTRAILDTPSCDHAEEETKDTEDPDFLMDFFRRSSRKQENTEKLSKQLEPSSPPVASSIPPLAELTGHFWREKTNDNSWAHNTATSGKAHLQLLVEYAQLCSVPLEKMDRAFILQLRDNVLKKLPRKRNTDPAFRSKTLSELLKMNHNSPLSDKSINEYLLTFGSFFEWCRENHYMNADNPAKRLQIQIKRKNNESRDRYSHVELIKIVDELANLPHATPKQQQRNLQLRWIVLIAMYQGMRQNEICQLFVDDVATINGIPCFCVNDSHWSKSLKNQQSFRQVPIHPELLKAGFLEYVCKLREHPVLTQLERNARNQQLDNSEQVRLLVPCMNYSPQLHFTRNLTNFYNQFNRKQITTDTKKTFHSFRHNVITQLAHEDVQRVHIAHLVGHETADTTTRVYTKVDIEKLLTVITKVNYGFNLLEKLHLSPVKDDVLKEQIAHLPVKE